jgi:hypothetical protein
MIELSSARKKKCKSDEAAPLRSLNLRNVSPRPRIESDRDYFHVPEERNCKGDVGGGNGSGRVNSTRKTGGEEAPRRSLAISRFHSRMSANVCVRACVCTRPC